MKRFILVFLSLALILFNVSVAFANIRDGDYILPTPEEQLESMRKEGYSEEEIEIARQKLFSTYSEQNFAGINPRVGTELNVTIYKQQNDHYCTVASVQSILKYLNSGFNKTQNSIATGTNTSFTGSNDLNAVRVYLNENQNKNIYVFVVQQSLSKYKGDTNTAITVYGVPTLINIRVGSNLSWPHYDSVVTNGHSVVGYGMSYDQYTTYIGDPIGGTYFDTCDMRSVPTKYPVTSSTVYQCLLGYMY